METGICKDHSTFSVVITMIASIFVVMWKPALKGTILGSGREKFKWNIQNGTKRQFSTPIMFTFIHVSTIKRVSPSSPGKESPIVQADPGCNSPNLQAKLYRTLLCFDCSSQESFSRRQSFIPWPAVSCCKYSHGYCVFH